MRTAAMEAYFFNDLKSHPSDARSNTGISYAK